MKAVDMLAAEHELIHQVLESLTHAREKIERTEELPREFFEKALKFCSNFADRFHHFKEEYLLFERLAERMNGKVDQYVVQLRREHESGREYLSRINAALDGYDEGRQAQTQEVYENLKAFTIQLRHHIHTEDHLFFPMVEQMLTAADGAEMDGLFKAELVKNGGEEFIERSREKVQQMGLILASLA